MRGGSLNDQAKINPFLDSSRMLAMNVSKVTETTQLFIEPVLAQHRWCESCVYTHQDGNRVGVRGANSFMKHSVDFKGEFGEYSFNTSLTL